MALQHPEEPPKTTFNDIVSDPAYGIDSLADVPSKIESQLLLNDIQLIQTNDFMADGIADKVLGLTVEFEPEEDTEKLRRFVAVMQGGGKGNKRFNLPSVALVEYGYAPDGKLVPVPYPPIPVAKVTRDGVVRPLPGFDDENAARVIESLKFVERVRDMGLLTGLTNRLDVIETEPGKTGMMKLPEAEPSQSLPERPSPDLQRSRLVGRLRRQDEQLLESGITEAARKYVEKQEQLKLERLREFNDEDWLRDVKLDEPDLFELRDDIHAVKARIMLKDSKDGNGLVHQHMPYIQLRYDYRQANTRQTKMRYVALYGFRESGARFRNPTITSAQEKVILQIVADMQFDQTTGFIPDLDDSLIKLKEEVPLPKVDTDEVTDKDR